MGIIIAIIISVVVLSRPKNGVSKLSTNTSSKNTKVVLNWWRPIDEPENFKDIIAQYEEQNPNVTINYVKKDPKDYLRQSLTAISAQTGPDIWSIHDSWIPEFKDSITPAPEALFANKKVKDDVVNKFFDAFYPPVVKDELVADGKALGLPLTIDTLQLYLNRQLLSKRLNDVIIANPNVNQSIFSDGPRTWDELETLVKLYTVKSGTTVDKSAISLGTASNTYRAQDILAALMMQNGAKLVSDDRLTATFNLPGRKQDGTDYNPGLLALSFLTSFANPASDNYTWNNTLGDPVQAFVDGKTAMLIGYPSLKKQLAQIAPTFTYKVIPLPQIKGQLKSADFASYFVETVPRSSANSVEAWKFIRYVTSGGLDAYLANTSRPSPKKHTDLPPTIFDRLNYSNPDRFQPDSAKSWYRGKQPGNMESLFLSMINDVNAGANPLIALDSAATTATSLLRQDLNTGATLESTLSNPLATP